SRPPSLHHFPTRRSSALRSTRPTEASCPTGPPRGPPLDAGPCPASAFPGPTLPTNGPPCEPSASTAAPTPAAGPPIPNAPWPWRSEEHTSELQSRENLVC